ncbi:MAG: lysine biosynthesis protein LysX [Candidatus Odinarchaeia archaeon]
MKIGLICDRVSWNEKAIINAVRKRRGVELVQVLSDELILDASGNNHELPEADIYLQRCISAIRGLYVSAVLESKNIPVVNTYEASRICADKTLTILTLSKAGLPTPKTYLAFTIKSGLKVLEDKLNGTAVLKPNIGSWGRLVAILKDPQSAKSVLEDRLMMGVLYHTFHLQEYISSEPKRDIRVYVIGDKVVAGIYRYAPKGEWRTNTAGGGRAEPCAITPEIEEISLKAAEAVGGGVFGVDLMETSDGFVVHELNHTTEYRNTVAATGIDVPGAIVDYLIKQVKK